MFLRPDDSLQGTSGHRRASPLRLYGRIATPSRVAPSRVTVTVIWIRVITVPLALAGHSSRLRLGVGVRFVGLIIIAGQCGTSSCNGQCIRKIDRPGPSKQNLNVVSGSLGASVNASLKMGSPPGPLPVHQWQCHEMSGLSPTRTRSVRGTTPAAHRGVLRGEDGQFNLLLRHPSGTGTLSDGPEARALKLGK